ncbi:pyridoxamine 5'-phosphate oxidase family protein [Caulobacter sp. 602-2]|uniref:Pyridoxamine 5'-phosphate oxidase family protein n=1 Tax=Caulobacter sp. 602-2 TaxID=2710887 RepID=A0A6G4QWV7_9CAUL|nr:pyridoxamine 5'-phosphate oxidase family protein [Caulobacter sp. 602-2]NGM49725.1 pyridoxamine 5'-phosphate oxidase family protein [Caulobacter sp. 602-2]
MAIIDTLDALEAIYSPAPVAASTAKVSDRLTSDYRRLIEASPFLALATVGPEGLDCSPRGDAHGLVTIADERTLILPDRRGNNRIDSLRNIVRDPRVALLFLIPGSGTTFRVNGRAVISADADLLARLAVDGKAPRTALIVTIEECYFQCARAVMRAGLWSPEAHVDPKSLPSAGAMLAAITAGEVGGPAYDEAWPTRAAASMW